MNVMLQLQPNRMHSIFCRGFSIRCRITAGHLDARSRWDTGWRAVVHEMPQISCHCTHLPALLPCRRGGRVSAERHSTGISAKIFTAKDPSL